MLLVTEVPLQTGGEDGEDCVLVEQGGLLSCQLLVGEVALIGPGRDCLKKWIWSPYRQRCVRLYG